MPSHARRMFKSATLSQVIMIACLGVGIGGTLFTLPAIAQTIQAQPSAAQRAEYNIPAGNLDRVLNGFAAATGIHLAIDGSLTTNLSSPGLQGRYTVDAGLAEILSGTGLLARRQADGSYTLQQSGTDGVLLLDPVKVIGKAEESAYGPVEGYVAKRSATGTKTDTPLMEIPRSISVVSREQMDRRDVKSLTDALSYTAAVIGSHGDETRYDTISIRGYDIFDGGGGLYRDGLQVNAGPSGEVGVQIEPYGLERVEVIKGPASFLYGRAAPGGLINTVTKRPTTKAFARTDVLVGSYNRRQLAIDLGGPINASGEWLYRFTALGQDSDAQQDFSKEDRLYVAPAVTWRPSEDTEWTLLASFQKDETGAYPGFLPASGTVDSNPNGKLPESFSTGSPGDEDENQQLSISLLTQHQLGTNLRFRQNLRYTDRKYDNKGIFGYSLAADNRTLNRGNYSVNSDVRQIYVDNQFLWTFTTGTIEHDLLFGVDHQRDKETSETGFSVAPTLDIFNPVYDTGFEQPGSTSTEKIRASQLGLYVQDQIKVTDRWLINLGGRRDKAKSKVDDNRQSDSASTWNIGLLYKAPHGLSPYFSYAESFFPAAGTDFFTGEVFKPVTSKQYEIGIKWATPDDRSLVTLSAYELEQNNTLTGVPGVPGEQTQTGQTRSRGFELESTVQIGKHWRLMAAYAYLDSEYTRDTDLQGLEREQSPKNSASLWVRYDDIIPGLSLGSGVRYVGKRVYGYRDQGTPAQTTPLFHESKTIADFNLEYNIQNITANLNVRNLFDKETYSCYNGRYGFCVPDAGREASLRLRYDW